MKNQKRCMKADDYSRRMYTPSAYARGAFFCLRETGERRVPAGETVWDAEVPTLLWLEVLDGAGELEYGGRVYEMSAGSCALIDCRAAYRFRAGLKGWTLRWACFDGPAAGAVYARYAECGGQAVVPAAVCAGFWQRLMDVLEAGEALRDLEIHACLADLMVRLMKEGRRLGDGGDALEDGMPAVKKWLDEHYAERITLERLSGLFSVSRFSLSKRFRARYGETVISYLTMVRVTRAKELLLDTEMSLEEIGKAVGITPARYLSEVFSSVEGISPGAYRRRNGIVG